MELFVRRLQMIGRDVGINLRGRNVAVAEHHLHRSQIGAIGQQGRRKTMAEHVRRDVADFGQPPIFLDDPPEFLACHWAGVAFDKKKI